MSGAKVVCPGCKITMQLPPSVSSGNVQCPSCSMVMTIRPPGSPPPARPQPQPQTNPFEELPTFQTPRTPPPGPTVRLQSRPAPAPAVSQPAPARSQYSPTPSHYRSAAPTSQRRGSGTSFAKVLGMILASVVGLVVMCGGGLVFFAVLGSRFSGWETTQFHGCTIKVPPGKQLRERTDASPGFTVHEVAYRRKETGSQYFLLVSEQLPAQLRGVDIKRLVATTVTLSDQQMVMRSGVSGLQGTVIRGPAGFSNCQAEYFIQNGRMVVTIYAPYSVIRNRVGGERAPRTNELELDRPDEFFESLSFR